MSHRSLCYTFAALIAAAIPAWSQQAPPLRPPYAVVKPGAIAPTSVRARASEVEATILTVLDRDLKGQPVIATSAQWPYLDADTIKVRPSDKLLSRVQDVADGFSTAQQQCVPFAVRGAWVLAPGTRKEVNTDFSKYSPLDVSGRTRIFTEMLVTLSARETDFLCSQNGLVVGSLDKKLQTMMARALRPPFRAAALRPQKDYPDNLEEVPNGSRNITSAPDLSRVRIRAQLRSIAPCLLVTQRNSPDSDYEYTNTYDMGQMPAVARLEMRPDNSGVGFGDSGTDLPALFDVPNTYKPTDLDGRTLTQPFGAHGIMSIEDVLKRLSVVTGRKYKASVQFASLHAFIGADTITCGEVADGLRLALTATWRHIGDLYFLTWDKMGLGALQTYVLERGQDLTHASDKASQEASQSENWLDLAMRIPFAADDPMAWTAGQRQILFGPNVKRPNGGSETPYVRWAGLTPSQQAFIRSYFAGRKINMPDPTAASGAWHEREVTDQDLRSAGLRGQAKVELCIDLGDGAWLTVGDAWYKTIDQSMLESFRYQQKSRIDEAKRKADEAKRYGAGQRPPTNTYRPPERTLAAARRRALMAPVMSVQRLAKLATQMQVRGITTLFYPVLSNGYATFPSKAFPPHPDMGTPNGWLKCVGIMKAAGITVIGTMETLAWRKTDQKGHWLDQHPDWLDLDILGRPLSDHLRAEADRMLSPLPFVTGDIVRATEPQVATRLTTLLAEYMRQPGSSAICLDAWDYTTAQRSRQRGYGGYYNRSDNPLGCAVPDRLASILANGVDPVDVPSSYGGFPAPPLAAAYAPSRRSMDWNLGGGFAPAGSGGADAPPPTPFITLASTLLPKARPDAAPWTTYAVVANRGMGGGYGRGGPPTPPASVLLDIGVTGYGNNASRSMILRVPSRKDRSSANMNQNANLPAMAAAEAETMGYGGSQPADLVVYDFRGAPEEIDDSLRRVGIPEDVASTK